MPRPRLLLLYALAALPVAALAKQKMQWEIDREIRKVERRLYGPDEGMRDACGTALAAIDDRPLELARSVEMRRSDVRVHGTSAAALRPCARAVAGAGIVEGWRVTQGTAGTFVLSVRLLRARRDPRSIGRRRTEETEREAVKALESIWGDRNADYEALGAEVVAPDLVDLHEARWNAGNLSFEGRAPDDAFADGYRRLVRSVVSTGARIEWAITSDAPVEPAPELPEKGLLRGAFRSAEPAAVLRLFAEIDRRDFVALSGGPTRSGGLGGGWAGIVDNVAKGSGKSALRVGQIDVLAPPGLRAPERRTWNGRRVTFELDAVPSKALWTLFAAASNGTVEGPDDLAPTDLQAKNVPWDQLLEAVALAHGCTVVAPGATTRRVECPPVSRSGTPPPWPPGPPDPRPPLAREPASRLKVVAFGARDTGRAWRAVLRTPAGLHVLARTGSPIGVDGGLAVVDERGVSVVLERARPDGSIARTAVPIPF